VWSYDPESYAGGSVASGRASNAGQGKGDDPQKKEYPCSPGWGLGVRLATPAVKLLQNLKKKNTYTQEAKARPGM
jgi:hypothetical protein